MTCRDCIWFRTLVMISPALYECEESGNVVIAGEERSPCEKFEHKDFPKRVGYGADV